jgi:glycerol-3-phosphate dehydrogenase
MQPVASEEEIQWVLKEAGKYLNPEFPIRRQDVLSAWSGIRPLANDPFQAASTSQASRDHLISVNPKTSTVFISGGKWTTYREVFLY